MNRVFITPLAKKIASINKIDFATLKGSGPRGRIIKSDIERHIKNNNLETMSKSPQIELDSLETQKETLEIPKLRRIIADKLTLSKSTIPHFYLRRNVQVDNLLQVRQSINNCLDNKIEKISINDFFIKASAISLTENPDFNVSWGNETLTKFKSSNVGVAISTEKGLYTPTLMNLEIKSISQISKEMKLLIDKANKKTLRVTDFGECAHAISNLGMFKVENFDAIINPPNSSILAIGCVQDRIRKVNDEFQNTKSISITLSVDHRAIDGAMAAKFLDRIVYYLENPNLLIIK